MDDIVGVRGTVRRSGAGAYEPTSGWFRPPMVQRRSFSAVVNNGGREIERNDGMCMREI